MHSVRASSPPYKTEIAKNKIKALSQSKQDHLKILVNHVWVLEDDRHRQWKEGCVQRNNELRNWKVKKGIIFQWVWNPLSASLIEQKQQKPLYLNTCTKKNQDCKD